MSSGPVARVLGTLRRGSLAAPDARQLERWGSSPAVDRVRPGDVLLCLGRRQDWICEFLILRPAGVEPGSGDVLLRAEPGSFLLSEPARLLGSVEPGQGSELERGATVRAPRAILPEAFVAMAERAELERAAELASPAPGRARRAGI